MEAWIFMKFETYAHKIIFDHQPNFHCKDVRARVVNAWWNVQVRVYDSCAIANHKSIEFKLNNQREMPSKIFVVPFRLRCVNSASDWLLRDIARVLASQNSIALHDCEFWLPIGQSTGAGTWCLLSIPRQPIRGWVDSAGQKYSSRNIAWHLSFVLALHPKAYGYGAHFLKLDPTFVS